MPGCGALVPCPQEPVGIEGKFRGIGERVAGLVYAQGRRHDSRALRECGEVKPQHAVHLLGRADPELRFGAGILVRIPGRQVCIAQPIVSLDAGLNPQRLWLARRGHHIHLMDRLVAVIEGEDAEVAARMSATTRLTVAETRVGHVEGRGQPLPGVGLSDRASQLVGICRCIVAEFPLVGPLVQVRDTKGGFVNAFVGVVVIQVEIHIGIAAGLIRATAVPPFGRTVDLPQRGCFAAGRRVVLVEIELVVAVVGEPVVLGLA